MAQNEKKTLTEEMQKRLVKTSATNFSVHGYVPNATEWKLTPDQIRDIIKTHASATLDDIADVTLEINHKSGAISAFVWIPRDSKHLVNNELKNSNSAIKRSLTRYSQQLKEFIDKFCEKDDKRLYQEEGGLNIVGIRVRVDIFMKLEFDESGNQYAKVFGDENRKKTFITLTSNYSRAEDGRFGKLNYIQVKKELKNRYSSTTPRPRRSYNSR